MLKRAGWYETVKCKRATPYRAYGSQVLPDAINVGVWRMLW